MLAGLKKLFRLFNFSDSDDNITITRPTTFPRTVTVSGALTVPNDTIAYAKIQNVSATDKLLGRATAGTGDVEEIACTAAGRALLDDANAAAQCTTLGLVIGTNVQAYDAGLLSIAGLTTAADRMIYTTANDVYAVITLTAAGRALLDDADAAAQLATLGITPVAAAINLLTQGVAAGYKVARGTLTPITESDTVVTGLTTVVAAIASLKGAPTLTCMFVAADIGNQAGSPAAGSIYIKSYKPTAANDVTPIASTTPWSAMDWIAIGT